LKVTVTRVEEKVVKSKKKYGLWNSS
jgi:hypothetical protein